MQTQFQQGSKKNKVVVPFYTPPSRLYGQTPAEIIKEARAAVMPTPALGIKPVFTTRPFTPKDNERTLFGSFKNARRHSPISGDKSHNLSKSPESSGQVKLPSIGSPSKRKIHSIFYYSNNLSLENLVEDYDAEILEEETDEIKGDKLPSWKKSHSCPKEGRMIKAASYSELNQKLFFSRNVDWDAVTRTKEGKQLPKSGSELEKKDFRQKQKKSSLSTIFRESIEDDTMNHRRDLYQLIDITRGCGDHEPPLALDAKSLLMETQMKNSSKQSNIYERGDHGKQTNPIKTSRTDIPAVGGVLPSSEIKEEQRDQREHSIYKSKEVVPIVVKDRSQIKSIPTGEPSSKPLDEVKISRNSDGEMSSEKSTGTSTHKSEYLLKLQESAKNSSPEESSRSIPMEILELYQTAEYYGVNLNDGGSRKKHSEAEDPQENSKINISEKTDAKIQIRGRASRENPSIVDPYEKSKGKTSAKPDRKTVLMMNSIKENNLQFPMNDKKRYHVVGDKIQTKEKAYEKWIAKQNTDVSPPKESAAEGSWDIFWKNCYYAAKKEDNREEEKRVTEKPSDLEVLQRLLNKSTELFKLGGENSTIYDINCELYRLLRSGQYVLDNSFKEKILKTVCLNSDNEDPRVFLSIARLLFFLKLDSSLTAACKMIFNVARFDSNDHLFLNEEDILELFMEGVGRASPLEYAESCIYGYGALKFLTMNYNILSRTLHMGALDLMTLHLKLINTACAENGSVGEQTQHALFQLTGVLRHVAAGEGALPLFITTNCISVICKNLELFQKDEDIVTNISRTLSLVSTDESITQVLMSVENILSLIINLMERYKEHDKILIRLSFCLGNIVEHSDLARIQLLRNDTSLSTLLNLLKFYIDKDLEISMGQTVSTASGDLNSEVVDDIIVKVIRIIANMSMNPIVGSNLSPVANEKKSLQLSHLLSVLLLRKDPGMALLATLGCLNNVSYYCNSHSALIDITQGIERVLGLESEDCQAEAARVLGNLTRHKEIRDLIFNTGGVNQLIRLLGSKDQEVVRCACGALVNMLLDPECRKQFLEGGGIDKLVDAMDLFSGDWSLASLAGRAIWNSCADDLSSAALYNNLERIMNTLATSLEEENWKDGDVAWEEFASIATDLLERINSHLESPQ